jgi:hypothetical protein
MNELITTLLDPPDQYVHIASEYAIKSDGYNSSVCTFNLQTRPIGDRNNGGFCLNVGVVHANIPHTWYNMYHGLRFIIQFQVTSTSINETTFGIQISDKNYDGESLAAEVESKVLEKLATTPFSFINFNCSYGDDGFFRFTSDYDFNFKYTPKNIYYELGLKQLHVGLKDSNIADRFDSNDYRLISSFMGDLSGFHSIYIHVEVAPSNQLASYNGCQPNNSICRIPIRSSYLDIELYEPANIVYVPLYNKTINQLDITLRDDAGNILDLHGCDWSATLHFRFTNV